MPYNPMFIIDWHLADNGDNIIFRGLKYAILSISHNDP